MGAAAVGELGIGKSESKKRAAELQGDAEGGVGMLGLECGAGLFTCI